MSGIGFTDEFKADAVAQVVDRDIQLLRYRSVLGSAPSHVDTWKAQFSQPRKQIKENTERASEIKRLKKELSRVSEERDI